MIVICVNGRPCWLALVTDTPAAPGRLGAIKDGECWRVAPADGAGWLAVVLLPKQDCVDKGDQLLA